MHVWVFAIRMWHIAMLHVAIFICLRVLMWQGEGGGLWEGRRGGGPSYKTFPLSHPFHIIILLRQYFFCSVSSLVYYFLIKCKQKLTPLPPLPPLPHNNSSTAVFLLQRVFACLLFFDKVLFSIVTSYDLTLVMYFGTTVFLR